MPSFTHKGGLGRPVTWHLPSGTFGPPSRWAATSNVKVGQTPYPVNRGRVLIKRKNGDKDSHKKEERERGVEWGKGTQGTLGKRSLF